MLLIFNLEFLNMNIHLIAIGGSAMHNIALALHNKGYTVSGSDDKIFEPSKSRLKKYGLLPKYIGWFPEKISRKLDAVILGMHAKINNPELAKAKALNIPIFSYPEYIYEQTKNKKRIVIGGSHGKTTITSMILHVLNELSIECDYLVGAQLEGFETMVKLTNESPVIILEGDEYLSSPIDRRPKFHLYHPHIAVLSGIAWDHINVFPTFTEYVNQFRIFKNLIKDTLIYFEEDVELKNLIKEDSKCKKIAYNTPKFKIKDGETYIDNHKLSIFGEHNLQNMNAARLVCKELGVKKDDFYNKIMTFKGASNRLELIHSNEDYAIYKDFAHSPSKLKATINAMKNQFPDRELISCIELHTYSSLNVDFLKEYNQTMKNSDIAIVYYNIESIKHKGLDYIKKEDIYNAFNDEGLIIHTNTESLKKFLKNLISKEKNLLMMSSGNFDNLNLNDLIK